METAVIAFGNRIPWCCQRFDPGLSLFLGGGFSPGDDLCDVFVQLPLWIGGRIFVSAGQSEYMGASDHSLFTACFGAACIWKQDPQPAFEDGIDFGGGFEYDHDAFRTGL